ncbi:Serine/threonine-protein kinase TNNI3K [Chionoecetes opilio]|uniref:Serine/threonine-protein kinase TNNI3K n=1 Tax=Chionoecetes opilio TaxID=41210 RepID=A0A8J5CGR2_CHIOP|nr:Serine/threonine-protein kinase TNNI3K [Chionoecetes opilio]
MGNYKSRPRSTCSQELCKKILQNYAHLEEKIQEDLEVDFESLTEIQQVCSNGTVDQLASLLNSETVCERLDNGMTLLHLCCIAAAISVKDDTAKDLESNETEGKSNVSYDMSVLQLMRSPREKSDHGDRNQEHVSDQSDVHTQDVKQSRSKEVREQIRLLLKKGADPAIISKNGFSPLHIASYKVKTTP